MANINDAYYSVLSGYSGSVDDKRSALLTDILGYTKPMSLNDMEKAALANLGYTGSLDDAWNRYLKALGGIGLESKADLLSSTFYGNPIPLVFANSEPGAWYDPSDLTTLFQDSAGTTPVTAAGQPVGRMLDKSGRGNHATQSTEVSRPTYQVDSNGRPFLLFDGINDGMVTPTITPDIDKVQVFAGLRKLSDLAVGIVVESSTSANVTSGSFYFGAPALVAANYSFLTGGTSDATVIYTNASVAAPTTNVVTAVGDISADVARLRVNGTQVATLSVNQGTGNYLAYPLYIGRRGGTALSFNGRIYSLIVRFGPNMTTGQITTAERWVNSKTGAY
jgi:hypothetical protein